MLIGAFYIVVFLVHQIMFQPHGDFLQVMERGKLLQERQTDNDELKKEIENQEKKMETLIADFNQKQDLVNSNLRVSYLKCFH